MKDMETSETPRPADILSRADIVFAAPHTLHLTTSDRMGAIPLAIVVDVSLNDWEPDGRPRPRSQQPQHRYPLPDPPRHSSRPAHALASSERDQDTKEWKEGP